MTWTIGSNALGPDNDTCLRMSASPHFRFIDMVFHPVSHKSSVSRDHQPNWEIALFWKTVSKNLLKRKKVPIWNEERKVLWSHTLCRGISYCVIGVNPCEDLEPPALPCFWASAGLQTGSHLASVNDSNRIKWKGLDLVANDPAPYWVWPCWTDRWRLVKSLSQGHLLCVCSSLDSSCLLEGFLES